MAYPTITTSTPHVSGPAGAHLAVFEEQGQRVRTTDLAASQPQPLDVRGLPGGLNFRRDAATGHSARFIKRSGR